MMSPSLSMTTWLKLCVGVALLGVALARKGREACYFDDPVWNGGERISMVLGHIDPCFKAVVSDKQRSLLIGSTTLDTFQEFSKDVCSHIRNVTTCMADVWSRITSCENKDVVTGFRILLEWLEHLMVGGCEAEGDRLAHVLRGMFILIRERLTHVPFRRCFFKQMAFIKLTNGAKLDVGSESYIFHQEFPKLNKCMELIEDEGGKTVFQWLLDETASSFKCKHPEEDTVVPCSEVDASKLNVTDVCKLGPFDTDQLYQTLESSAMVGCYGDAFSHDKLGNNFGTDLSWLLREYKTICKTHRELPTCLLQVSAYGETCLSQQEAKQFQLQIQAIDDAMLRMCVEEGARLAAVMHEVYKNSSEHGHAIRDCYKSVEEASKSHEDQAMTNKNIRFYRVATALKQCVVEKLHGTNDLARNVEAAFNDVLKEMKCVKPEDGSVVLCETIHEH